MADIEKRNDDAAPPKTISSTDMKTYTTALFGAILVIAGIIVQRLPGLPEIFAHTGNSYIANMSLSDVSSFTSGLLGAIYGSLSPQTANIVFETNVAMDVTWLWIVVGIVLIAIGLTRQNKKSITQVI
jgi:hypothetical protein